MGARSPAEKLDYRQVPNLRGNKCQVLFTVFWYLIPREYLGIGDPAQPVVVNPLVDYRRPEDSS